MNHVSLFGPSDNMLLCAYKDVIISSNRPTQAHIGGTIPGKDELKGSVIDTETVVMRSVTGAMRWIRAEHRQRDKFHLDQGVLVTLPSPVAW
jgi:hypothetical protein